MGGQSIYTINPDFAKWAAGFSGCDGGNPKGRIWLCGIEWGLSGSGPKYNVLDEFRHDVTSAPTGYKDADGNSPQFNQKFIKLLAAMKAANDVAFLKVFKEHPIPFHKDSDLFKLNAYPLAFKSDGDERWNEDFYRATGFPTKSLYRAWCQTHRFPIIKSWVEKYSPALIIATGTSYRTDYQLAFGGVEAVYPKYPATTEDLKDGQQLVYLPVNGGKTILAVIPFLGGRHGLNSDLRIRQFGAALSRVLIEHVKMPMVA